MSPVTPPEPRPLEPTACFFEVIYEGGSFGQCPECGSDKPHVRLATPAAEAGPEPGLDVERERELRKRLTRHHRDEHVTALTCRSCIAALEPRS